MKHLTKYQLACGHVQQETLLNSYLFDTKIELYQEYSCYHVRAFQRVKGSSSSDKISWLCFNTLTEARKYYKELKRIIEVRHEINLRSKNKDL